MVIPAVVLVLSLCVLGLFGMGVRSTLVSVAGQVARQSARGDDPGAIRNNVARALDGVEFSTHTEGDLLCATTRWHPVSGPGWLGDAVGPVEACALNEQERPNPADEQR